MPPINANQSRARCLGRVRFAGGAATPGPGAGGGGICPVDGSCGCTHTTVVPSSYLGAKGPTDR
jgi:hypothetical protein